LGVGKAGKDKFYNFLGNFVEDFDKNKQKLLEP